MNVQFLSNEKGKKTDVVIPTKDWEEIQEKLKRKDVISERHCQDMSEKALTGVKSNLWLAKPSLMMR